MKNEDSPIILLNASKEEFDNLKVYDDLFPLFDKYQVMADCHFIEIVYSLSRIFSFNDKHILIKIEKNIIGVKRVFKVKEDFIEKVISFEREEMDSFGYKLREDKHCKERGFDSMGVWVFLYFLHDCCSLALKDEINLYLYEDDKTYIVDEEKV